MAVPEQPKIYHITHVDNLPSILGDGGLLPDSEMTRLGRNPPVTIGISAIKERRLGLPVTCHRGDSVGDYVPFFFCPRSPMLYLISRRNHPDLTYTGGQSPILHLEADLRAVVEWAQGNGRRWAFSLSNAGAKYTQFRSRLEDLEQLNWDAIAAADFRKVKEDKMAEFLMHEGFPWTLVSRIGAFSKEICDRARVHLTGAAHRPALNIMTEWYF